MYALGCWLHEICRPRAMMNSLVRLPEVSATMVQMSKEMTKVLLRVTDNVGKRVPILPFTERMMLLRVRVMLLRVRIMLLRVPMMPFKGVLSNPPAGISAAAVEASEEIESIGGRAAPRRAAARSGCHCSPV